MQIGISTAVLVTFSLAARTASADGTGATCDRLRAEARADAVVLYAPRVVVEGARAPSVTDASDPVAITNGLQARGSLSWSAIDAMRGRAIERTADADCAVAGAIDRASRVLGVGARMGELAATRAEIAYLEGHMAEIDALVADAVERFAHERATAIEVDELSSRRATFRMRLSAARREAGDLEEIERNTPAAPQLAQLANDVRSTVLEADRRRADVRALSAWRVDVRAGVAGSTRADWFAIVELGYSLGQVAQARANRRAIQARDAELASDDRAVPGQLERLHSAMQRSVTELTSELTTIETEIAAQRAERDRLAAIGTDAAKPLVARFTLEVLELEARRTFLSALAAARRPYAGVVSP